MKRRSVLYVAVLHVGLALLCMLTLYPVLWVVKMALSPAEGLSLSANPFPEAVTFEHFSAVLGAHDSAGRWVFGRQLLSSIVVSGATTLVGLSLAVSAAYALSSVKFSGKSRARR